MFYNNYQAVIKLLFEDSVTADMIYGDKNREEAKEGIKKYAKEHLTPEQYTLFLLAVEEK